MPSCVLLVPLVSASDTQGRANQQEDISLFFVHAIQAAQLQFNPGNDTVRISDVTQAALKRLRETDVAVFDVNPYVAPGPMSALYYLIAARHYISDGTAQRTILLTRSEHTLPLALRTRFTLGYSRGDAVQFFQNFEELASGTHSAQDDNPIQRLRLADEQQRLADDMQRLAEEKRRLAEELRQLERGRQAPASPAISFRRLPR